MRGSVATEALIISAIAVMFLIIAGKALQAYGTAFAEDVDRILWLRESGYKIYSAVRALEICGTGSRDTLDVYVPEGGLLELSGDKIRLTIANLERNYPATGGTTTYTYEINTGVNFSTSATLPPGWARIRLERTASGIDVTVLRTGIR